VFHLQQLTKTDCRGDWSPTPKRSTFMRKTNCLHLLLTVAALAALPLIAVSARADKGDIYETNMGMVLRILPSGGTTPITFAQGLPNPKGLVFDGSGRLYVADASAGSITLFTLPDGTAGTYTTGLSSPVGVALDVLGNLYVGESGSGNISKFARDGTKTSFASGLGAPSGLAFDNSGNLFVADFAGGVIYQITPVGTKTTFATGLGAPAGLAFDSAGNLFEADSSTGSILKFAPNGTKTTFATGLSRPYGLAFEASGDLIVSDNGNGSTFRFTPAAVRTTVFNSNFNTPQFVAIEPATHQLLNISTRGFVEGGNHILIAGFIIGGSGPIGTTVVVRAIGPSLSTAGIVDPLADPLLVIRNSNGTLVASNDNWQDAPLAQRVGGTLAPPDAHESALQLVLQGGAYTAIVTSANGMTGTALVEVYNLQ
jgi:sugar lactone lactonase YvrE